MPNWALFIETDEIKWTFGLKENLVFQNTTVRFIQSLQAIGRELYEQGVASIKLDTLESDLFSTKEIFIINLSDQFFFVISDLIVTSKLIAETDSLPYDVAQIICAVLVGQAAIIYSYLKEGEINGTYSTDDLFRSILKSMNLPYDIDFLVADGRCSLSPLNFQELLIFHYLLRNHFERSIKTQDWGKKDAWAIMVHKDGTDFPLSYKSPQEPVLLGNFLGAIYSYVQALFGVKPQALVFGGSTLTYLQYFGGKKYFLACSNPQNLFQDKMFLKIFHAVQEQKKLDVTSAIREYLVRTLSTHFKENLLHTISKYSISDALEIFTIEKSEQSLENQEPIISQNSDKKIKKNRKNSPKKPKSTITKSRRSKKLSKNTSRSSTRSKQKSKRKTK